MVKPDSGADIDAEKIALTWQQAEYRRWVQHQIANRMLFVIGGIGISSVARDFGWLLLNAFFYSG